MLGMRFDWLLKHLDGRNIVTITVPTTDTDNGIIIVGDYRSDSCSNSYSRQSIWPRYIILDSQDNQCTKCNVLDQNSTHGSLYGEWFLTTWSNIFLTISIPIFLSKLLIIRVKPAFPMIFVVIRLYGSRSTKELIVCSHDYWDECG